jgi:hypothetical protein
MKKPIEKKPKTASRKKAVVGPASAYCLPDPLKVEKITNESGERMTKLTFGEPFTEPVSHSADRFFSAALEIPSMLVDPLGWFIIKPWLQNDPAEIEGFWTGFNTPMAIQERMSATSGIKSVKWQKERVLIQMVHATRRLLSEPDGTISSSGLFPLDFTLLCRLGEWVMNTVENDHNAARRLYQLLQDSSAADDESNEEFVNRGVFNAFALLVATDQKLPTKKRVREKAFIGNDQSGLSTASRAYRELGLSGLPEG